MKQSTTFPFTDEQIDLIELIVREIRTAFPQLIVLTPDERDARIRVLKMLYPDGDFSLKTFRVRELRVPPSLTHEEKAAWEKKATRFKKVYAEFVDLNISIQDTMLMLEEKTIGKAIEIHEHIKIAFEAGVPGIEEVYEKMNKSSPPGLKETPPKHTFH